MIECKQYGCDNKTFCKGFCRKHYERFKKYGNPNTVNAVFGEDRLSHPLYRTYCSMKCRCYNKAHIQYDYYGGRGIKVCNRWLGQEGFTNFCNDMGEKPSKHYSIDRIDNNGDYTPHNCRRATRHEQQSNRNISNKVVGVYYEKKKNLRKAMLHIDKKIVLQKRFKNIEDAIKCRKEAEIMFLSGLPSQE